MRILVTGGAGYVGSTLVPLLLEHGHQVRVLDCLLWGGGPLLGVWSRDGFEFVRGDVRDALCVRQAIKGCDAVVHLSAIVGDPACSRQADLAKAVNLDASRALLEIARQEKVSRFIFASTCSNYGKSRDPDRLADENSELSPVSLYAQTKVEFERAVLDPSRTGAMCATALRFATVFGVSARMRFDLTVSEFTMELIVRKHLKVYGEQFWRPYVHVRDAARGILTVLHAPPQKIASAVFNVGSTKENYQKKQLVELIVPHAPGATVEYVHKNEDPRDYRVSFEKIRRELGYRTTRTVPDGIREVADLIRQGVVTDFDNPRYRN